MKQSNYLAQETQFKGGYSRAVFQTLYWSYRPFLASCCGVMSFGFLGRLLLLSNANLVGLWADSLCRGPRCRAIPSFMQSWSHTEFMLMLAIVTLVGFVLTLSFRVAFSRLSAKAVSQLYDEVTYRTSRYPIQFFDTTPAGRIVTRFSSDYGNVFRLFGGPLAELLSIVFDLVCMIILITLASPYFLFIVLGVGCLNFLVYRLNQKSLRRERRELSMNRSPAVAHFAETVQGAGTIRAFLKQSSFMKRFHNLNELFLGQKLRTTFVITRFSLQMNALTALLLLATGVASYQLVTMGQVSVGSIGVAFSFITLSGSTVQMFFEWLAQFEEAMVGVERLDNYLRSPLEPGLFLPDEAHFPTAHPRKPDPARTLGAIKSASVSFHNVWLRYSPDHPFVLKGLNFEVRAGEKLGIIGRTGSGKSSLIQALFQFYPLERGEIRIAGLQPRLSPSDSSGVDLTEFRRSIGLIAQEPVLFQGSIRQNLTMSPLPDSILLEALSRVGLKDWIANFPEGLESFIAERGRNLSLGERQLLCMARCLLQDAPIVVMDEATSSVDPQSEEILIEATEKFFADRTQIIVAHRLSTLKSCDRILWLDHGEIRALGAPEEVLPLFQS